jgi:hypothetical protein
MSAIVPFFLASLAGETSFIPQMNERVARMRSAAILSLSLMTALVGWTFIEAHKPAKQLVWHRIAPETVPFEWTISFPHGEIACDPDELQVWVRDNKGELYAASGSALRHRFWSKSIDEASTIDRSTLVSTLQAVTVMGMDFCNTSFMGE